MSAFTSASYPCQTSQGATTSTLGSSTNELQCSKLTLLHTFLSAVR